MKNRTQSVMKKSFDAVSIMRSIRDDLSHRWYGHHEVMKKDLEKIRNEYFQYFGARDDIEDSRKIKKTRREPEIPLKTYRARAAKKGRV